MTYIISRVSVAQAATIINAFITFVQITLSLSLVLLLVHFMPKTNTALSWSSIGRTLHSSVWPTILRTDSSSSKASGAIVSTISRLTMLTTIFIAIAGVVLPLGLGEGPLMPSNYRQVDAKYVPDDSALALATTPDRENFMFGRQCGGFQLVPCPGNGDNPNTTTIAPSVLEIFNSTPHGPFTMQYRRFFDGDEKKNCSEGISGTAQTFIQRDGIFATEGLIVDMSLEHSGVGFWNQTVPAIKEGGMWSQEVLWLEPVTRCVDTNLTVDYFLSDGPDAEMNDFNLTDHGGFVNLSHEPPPLNRDGQHIDLVQHAYKGAGYSNLFAMLYLNATRESSSIGRSYPLNRTTGGSFSFALGKQTSLPLSYLNQTAQKDTSIICRGFASADTANVTNVHVDCGIFLGPPLRADNGDPRVFNRGSKWTQGIHACSSATRASIQRITFRTNGTITNLQDLEISRQPTNKTVLWATEKTDIEISNVDLFWGRVDDRYENDSSLWTVRSDGFYLPAGSTSIFNVFAIGQPSAAHIQVWSSVYAPDSSFETGLVDYTGRSDYAMKAKFQNLVQQNPSNGHAQIRNLVWTDIMANNFVGTQTDSTLLVAPNRRTISYDFKYAIPGIILLVLWVPSFLGAIFLLLTRKLTFDHMKDVFNHTSVGRVVVGTSALRLLHGGSSNGNSPFVGMPEPSFHQHYLNTSSPSLSDLRHSGSKSRGHRRVRSDWANTTGSSLVALDLSRRETYEEDIKLMSRI